MYQKIINTIVKLRRDNDYNYDKVKDTFIPLKGEMCIVDDSKYGVRAKVGDGVSTYEALPFEDSYVFDRVVERGYLINGEFYFTNDTNAEKLPHVDFKLYLDKLTGKVYYFNGITFLSITGEISVATDATAGIVKLYGTVGENTDGAMTQKAVTDALKEFIIQPDVSAETIEFKGFNIV